MNVLTIALLVKMTAPCQDEAVPPRFNPAAGNKWSYREQIKTSGGYRAQIIAEPLVSVMRTTDKGRVEKVTYSNRTVNGQRAEDFSTTIEYNPFPRNKEGDLETLELVVFAAFQQRTDLKAKAWRTEFTSKGDPVSIRFTAGPEQRIEKMNRWSTDLPAVRFYSGIPTASEYNWLTGYLEAEPTRRYDFVASRSGKVSSHLDGSMWISVHDGHLVALHSHSPDERLDNGTMIEIDTVRQEESSRWLGSSGVRSEASKIATITANVEQLTFTGVPGLLSCSPDWQTIVPIEGRSNAAFAAVRKFGKGRIAVIAHEGVLRNISDSDNGRFIAQLMAWLSSSGSGNVAVLKGKKAWVTLDQYAFSSENLESAADQDVGVLVIGNAWEPFSPDEIEAVTKHVSQGGGLLLFGLGWSWQQEHQDLTLADYPMNALAAPFGASWGASITATPQGKSGEVSLKIKRSD